MAKGGAIDMFMGMTHQWCGQYDFCDKMPDDLAKIWEQNLPKYMLPVGMWKGARYGIPIEHGNFQHDVHQRGHVQEGGPESRSSRPRRSTSGWRR